MLDRHQTSYHARVHHPFQRHEIRRITQDVAHGHDRPFAVGHVAYVLALPARGCHGFFEQYMVAHVKGFHARFVVNIVGQTDYHGVGYLAGGQSLRPVAEAVFFLYPVLVGHLCKTNGIYVGHTNHFHGIRIPGGIACIDGATLAGSEDKHGHLPWCVGLKAFTAEIYFVEFSGHAGHSAGKDLGSKRGAYNRHSHYFEELQSVHFYIILQV